MNAYISSDEIRRDGLSRRRFIVTTALVGSSLAVGLVSAADPTSDAPELGPYLTIAPDDTITVRVTTPEIGNGVLTQACMTVAEELHCDWSKIRAEFASVNRDRRENGIYSEAGGQLAFFSGRSTTDDRLRVTLQVGASARERLKTAAARRWNVPVAEVEAANSVLSHTKSGRRLRYGEVVADAAKIKLASEPALKPRDQWTLLGKATPTKLNNPQIVDGSAVYGMDVRLPGMVYAAVRLAPVHGGKLKSHDADAVRHMPGVRAVVVVDPTEPRKEVAPPEVLARPGFTQMSWAVAVIADHYWQARKALDALPMDWDDGPGGVWKSSEQMVGAAFAAIDAPGKVDYTVGSARDLVDKQGQVVEAKYTTPYCDHCVMEPLNGTALVTADRVDCWHPSQNTKLAFYAACAESGVKPENVYIHETFIGGGFGRRGGGDDVRMVVAVAKKYPGVPVHVIWSREETMRQGRYRPLTAVKLRAGLDDTGMPHALVAQVAGKGVLNDAFHDSAYALGCIPNIHVEHRASPEHLSTGPFRGPSYNAHTFVLESFIDECAHAAGADPLAYRLKLLAKWPDTGWVKCLNEVAAKAGWGKALPKGQGQGIAVANWKMFGKPHVGTTVACVATVEVTPAGELTVRQLDIAFDCGSILNKDAVVAQMEGGTIFALNVALNEALTIKDGRVVEGNFDDYAILRTRDVPECRIHLGGLTGHARFGEIGEAPAGPVGPAIGNAIFRATGKRVRATPFRKSDLSWT